VLVLSARALDDASWPRLGITASRKVGCAVVRSRVRRLVREAFRATRDLFPRDLDLVVIVKSAPTGLKLADVIAEWRSAERQLGKRLAEARKARQC
jgi:ribonuclease P protein component